MHINPQHRRLYFDADYLGISAASKTILVIRFWAAARPKQNSTTSNLMMRDCNTKSRLLTERTEQLRTSCLQISATKTLVCFAFGLRFGATKKHFFVEPAKY
jgi:hypothetical protein